MEIKAEYISNKQYRVTMNGTVLRDFKTSDEARDLVWRIHQALDKPIEVKDNSCIL
jgi:hypothetical protein